MQGWIPYIDSPDKNGFRLLFVDIQNHRVLARKGENCRLELFNYGIEKDVSIGPKPYTTVIIGSNGIGKSFILGAIAEIFRHLKELQMPNNNGDKKALDFRFAIQYFMNGHCYKISNLLSGWAKSDTIDATFPNYYCWEDERPCALTWCPLPTAVLASAVSISDRFKTHKKEDGFYWYLGTRNENSPSTTGTKTLVRKTVSAIAEGLSQNPSFRERLKMLLSVLGLEPRMVIHYSLRYKKVYLSEPMTEERFLSIFNEWQRYFEAAGSSRTSPPWGYHKFPEISDNQENVREIVRYLNKLRNTNQGGRTNHIEYSIDDSALGEDWKAIKLLTALDIMMYPTIRVFKGSESGMASESFLFEESSSGETNMLCQLINILSHIEQHSIVLIDEPETSAHPNWQIRYIDWLNEIFGSFHTCHFIISTHSHFLLTDLRKEHSAIVALKRDNGKTSNISEGLNTFCWSVDDILYKVFQVRNTRNEAFERDLFELYRLMKTDNPENKSKATTILNSLKDVVLRDGDPLKVLIDKAQKYVES